MSKNHEPWKVRAKKKFLCRKQEQKFSTPRIGDNGPKLKESVQDARDSKLNLPTFFLLFMDIKAKATQQNQMTSINAADKQLKDVAALYEKQFLREMVKQMRSTVSESELMPTGFAEKYYREQLDHQYVESWGDTGGIGLGKMIYDQLLDRYGAQL